MTARIVKYMSYYLSPKDTSLVWTELFGRMGVLIRAYLEGDYCTLNTEKGCPY